MTIESWTAKLNSRLVRMKVGLKIAFGRRRSVAIVTTEKVLHASILAEISKVIGPNGLNGEFKLNDLVERIVKLTLNSSNPSPTLRDRINVETNELARAGFFRFAQVCGVIGLWELNLRILAARLDVDIMRPENERGKRNAHLVDYADLSKIILALNSRIKALDLKLSRMNRLRNMFVHGNFHAARELVIARLTTTEKERYKGQVIALNLNNSRLTNLSEKLPKDELYAQDQFSWFLEVLGTELFDVIFEYFEDSLHQIHELILLRSLCFDRAQGAFERLVTDGLPLEGASLHEILANARASHVEKDHILSVIQKLNSKLKSNS